jgi:type IV pilus assembly protein PilW
VNLLNYLSKNKESGFTLVELMIAMTIGLIILAALSSTFLMQRKIYVVQEQIVEMVQTARAAMDMMTREIRMTGYNPTGSANATIIAADTISLTFTQDLNGDGDLMDGSNWDTNERIRYYLYTPDDGIQKIGRRTGGDTANPQPVAEHVQSLGFQYYDENGALLGTPVSVAGVRRIEVAIVVRTAKPDSDYTPNGGYRTYTLTSFITPRNLAF